MSENEYENVYIIPANFTDSGRVLNGLFETRNVVEAVIVALVLGFPIVKLLSFSLMVKVIMCVLLVLPVVVFALIGIDGDSLSQYILRLIRHKNEKKKIHLKRICYHYGLTEGENNSGKKNSKK